MAVMWQSTWASSVVTRPVKMYHATSDHEQDRDDKRPSRWDSDFESSSPKETGTGGGCRRGGGAEERGQR